MVALSSQSIIPVLTSLISLLPLGTHSQLLPGPYAKFRTQPNFVPSAINITTITNDRSLLAPGYYFVAPHMGARGWGPQIIDQDGELIWYGHPAVRKVQGRYMNAMNFQKCDYLGQKGNHLCFSEAQPDTSDRGYRSIGVNRVLNNEYQPEGTPYSKAGKLSFPNPHEFQMLPGGNSFVQAVYQLRKMDLRPYKGDKVGYVYDGCFQEIDVRTRDQLFVWCSFDHFPVWDTMVFLNIPQNKVNNSTPTGGKGKRGDPWDPVHLNSIDKNEENCYLVSCRHMNQVLKIAGPHNIFGYEPGTIIWRFNGKNSSFTGANETVLGYQHHARFISTGENETIFTVFDNRGPGAIWETVHGRSSFKTISLNNVTGEATLLREHDHPTKLLSVAQGSAQLLPNGNALAGWGSKPQISEFDRNGTLLFDATFYARADGLTNYRVFKDSWVGRPKTKPKLIAYCQTCNPFGSSRNDDRAPLRAYVSWNGATEVKSWKFSISSRKGAQIWVPVITVPKKKFETKISLQNTAFAKIAKFAPYVRVEALDKDNNVLETVVAKTFVPKKSIADHCDMNGCNEPKGFQYIPKFSRADDCGQSFMPEIIGLIILFLVVEGGNAWLDTFISILINRVYDAPRPSRRPSRSVFRRLSATQEDEEKRYD